MAAAAALFGQCSFAHGPCCACSTPFRDSNIAAIAQLGERQTEDLEVPSSILGHGIYFSHLALWLHNRGRLHPTSQHTAQTNEKIYG